MKKNICTLCHESEDEYCNMDFTPDEIVKIKEDYAELGIINCCPFCYAEVDDGSPFGVDFKHATKTFECMDCGAVWRNHYEYQDMDVVRIPSRLTLCSQTDRLVFDAINELKKYGEDRISKRLHKLFTGGYRHAMV